MTWRRLEAQRAALPQPRATPWVSRDRKYRCGLKGRANQGRQAIRPSDRQFLPYRSAAHSVISSDLALFLARRFIAGPPLETFRWRPQRSGGPHASHRRRLVLFKIGIEMWKIAEARIEDDLDTLGRQG